MTLTLSLNIDRPQSMVQEGVAGSVIENQDPQTTFICSCRMGQWYYSQSFTDTMSYPPITGVMDCGCPHSRREIVEVGHV